MIARRQKRKSSARAYIAAAEVVTPIPRSSTQFTPFVSFQTQVKKQNFSLCFLYSPLLPALNASAFEVHKKFYQSFLFGKNSSPLCKISMRSLHAQRLYMKFPN